MSTGCLMAADAEPGTRVAVLVESSDKYRLVGVNDMTYWFTHQEFELSEENREGALVIIEATPYRDFADDRVWKLVRG